MLKHLIFTFFFCFSTATWAQWTSISSGIDDELTSITFHTNTGLITGKKGAYFSTDGGTNASSWIRAETYFSFSDSISYNHSQFYGSAKCDFVTEIYLCGVDTVLNKAVIFSFNTLTFTLKSIYEGNVNSRLNNIVRRANNNQFYAVGDHGLIVTFSEYSSVVEIVPTTFTHDLNSIDIVGNQVIMAASDHRLEGTIDQNDPLSITLLETYHLNRNFKDFKYVNNYNAFGIGKNLYRHQNLTYTEPHLYFADSLDGNTLRFYAGQVYIGTSNGIFKTYNLTNVVENQPSAAGYHILAIQAGGAGLFACGKNGVILFSNNGGGVPVPFAQLTSVGGCVSAPVSISAVKGTVTDCKWYSDDVLQNNSCNNFSKIYSTAGTHTIKLIFGNNIYADTLEQTIHIVSIPITNLEVTIDDLILCKEETIDIAMDSSENNVYYTLMPFGSIAEYGSSGSGNGNALLFESNLLNQSGFYYLRASSNVASCYKNFTDTIHVIVEKTKASFHTSLVNATQNETVFFYENCTEASNFKWNFPNQPATALSYEPNPVNSFSQLGAGQVKLVAWSDNGCYDSVQHQSPYVYLPVQPIDSCWTMINTGYDDVWNGQFRPDIADMIASKTGYFIGGRYRHTKLKSQQGDSLYLGHRGAYVAKYTETGVLKWIVKSQMQNDENALFEDEVFSVREDSEGNVYFTGFSTMATLIDNTGDTIPLNGSAYLVKMDTAGRFLWRASTYYQDAQFDNIAIDNFDNIYLTAMMDDQANQFDFYHNGSLDIITDAEKKCTYCHNYVLIKLDPNGALVHDFLVEIGHNNAIIAPTVNFDGSNNMYLYGSREYSGVLHEPASSDTISLPFSPNVGGKMYLAKYDANGTRLWVVNSDVNNYCQAFNAVTDDDGNTYLTGMNNYSEYQLQIPQIIINADQTTTSFYGGKFFVAKVNSDGICEWIQGNRTTYYGYGYKIFIDNNQLKVLGYVMNITTDDIECQFTSQNGAVVEFEGNSSDFFINTYDFDGNLINLLKSGQSTGQTATNHDHLWMFVKLKDNLYLHARNINVYDAYVVEDFGTWLPLTEFLDGSVTKFHSGCGYTLYPHFLSESSDTICNGSNYTFTDNSTAQNITTTMVHEYTIENVSGIDSLIRTRIFLYAEASSADTIFVCEGEDYIHSDSTFQNIETPFEVEFVHPSVNGCDSTVYLTFMVHPVTLLPQTMELCPGEDVVLDNGVEIFNIQSDTNVTLVFQSIHGCDSTISLDIHVHPVTFNFEIVQQGNTLISQETADFYQWLDCDNNFFPFEGVDENAVQFNNSGNFAVILTHGTCSDTTPCFSFTYGLSLEELGMNANIYPNPTQDKVHIQLGQAYSSWKIIIFSNDGKEVSTHSVSNTDHYTLDLDVERGIYMIRIEIDNQQGKTYRIVKN